MTQEEMEEEVEETLPEAIPIDWSKDVPLPAWVQQADSTQKPNETWILEVTESGAPAGRISLDRYTTVLGSGAKVHRNHCHVLVTSATEGEADEGGRDIELCHAAVALNPASCDVFRGAIPGGTVSTSASTNANESVNGTSSSAASSSSSSSSTTASTTTAVSTSGTSKRNKLDFSLIDLNSHTGTKLNGRTIERGACVSLRAGDKFSLGESNKVFRLVRGVAAVHEKKSFAVMSLARAEELAAMQATNTEGTMDRLDLTKHPRLHTLSTRANNTPYYTLPAHALYHISYRLTHPIMANTEGIMDRPYDTRYHVSYQLAHPINSVY